MSETEVDLVQVISEAFDEYDLDKSGYLTHDEIDKLITALDENDKCKVKNLNEQREEFLQVFDFDGDKKVSKDEFVEAFLKMFLALLEEE